MKINDDKGNHKYGIMINVHYYAILLLLSFGDVQSFLVDKPLPHCIFQILVGSFALSAAISNFSPKAAFLIICPFIHILQPKPPAC